MSHQLNKQISEELKNRSYKISGSDSRKKILKFEENPASQKIFSSIKKYRFIWILMSILADRKLFPVTQEDIRDILKQNVEELKNILVKSPDKDLKCRNCDEVINTYNIDFDTKPLSKIKCPKCKVINDLSKCVETDDWDFPITSLILYLDEMVKIGLLSTSILGSCVYCSLSTEIENFKLSQLNTSSEQIKSFISKLFCKECERFYDLGYIYRRTALSELIWVTDDLWLEWDLKNTLKEKYPLYPIEQGICINRVQVDNTLIKNNKIINFECKHLNVLKRARFKDISEVLKKLDVSDKLFLITTAMINSGDKEDLIKRGEHKLIVIEGYNLEKITDEIDAI